MKRLGTLRPQPIKPVAVRWPTDHIYDITEARRLALSLLASDTLMPYVVLGRAKVKGTLPGQWVIYWTVLDAWTWELAGQHSALISESERWTQEEIHDLSAAIKVEPLIVIPEPTPERPISDGKKPRRARKARAPAAAKPARKPVAAKRKPRGKPGRRSRK